MFRRLATLLYFSLLLTQATIAQSPAQKPATPQHDYSKEAFVIESFSSKYKFENDGTSSAEEAARIRIQSEAGVQTYGILSFSYASGTTTYEVKYVRVHKPDGSVVETPQENVQDMAAQITRQAPFYSDLHEKHVAVKGLSVGDVLEYRTEEQTTKPLVPGQFWTSYKFFRDGIVLDEQFEISVPRDRAVKLRSAAIQPVTTDVGGYRVYTWKSSNLEHKDESNKKREATEQYWLQARGRQPQLDVLFSSFASWDEVGRWYGGLQEERVKPTAEVAAKAMELTKNLKDDEAKIRALYNYVAVQFHYIGIAFGIGRYQPHSAEAVLENQYGDCKDKHTLLASLLAAVGIPAYPALIDISREVDADVPSPGQFDHVITVVPRDSGMLWLDTTAEIGPYRYLISPLRDKHALVIFKDKPATLTATPVDLPYESTQTFTMEAKLSEAGALEGKAEIGTRGDEEVLFRAGFRAVALPQWKELGQRVSQSLGFGGEVSEVTATSPEKTDEPFHLSYKYTRKDFGDWPNHRIVIPSPVMTMPAPSEEESLPTGPTWLGNPTDIQFHSQTELPSGYRPELPAAIHLKWDFAQYDATYEFKDGKLLSQRHLKTMVREVPVSEREQYKQLAKTMFDDYAAFIQLNSGSSEGSATAQKGNISMPNMNPLAFRNLPPSLNEEAMRLENEARDAMAKNDSQTAVSSLYRAVTVDPKFTRAWAMLGILLLAQKQNDAGIDALHKAIATDPDEATIPKALGWALMFSGKCADAIPVWQDFAKAHPDDIDGPSNLGRCLMSEKKYSDAASAFEAALKIERDRPNLQASLGSAYLLAGEREKASTAFSKLGELNPKGDYLNDAAYTMANSDLNLPLALDYAKKAVRKSEEDAQKIGLTDLKLEDLQKLFQLSAYWDTLGWVYERMSNLLQAEQYLKASWTLSQDGVVAGHLCHLYRRTHQTATGIQMCRIALYRIPLSHNLPLTQYKIETDAAQENLDHMAGGHAKSTDTGSAVDYVIRERTFKLPRFISETESAEFFVLLNSDGQSKKFKVEDVKFISGSDKMKTQGKQLKTIDFNFPSPDSTPTRFVRRGILGCYQYTGCSFVLLDPGSVQKLD